MKLLEAKSTKLRTYLELSSGSLNIPYSQRPYEWGKEQAERLFNDLYSVHSNPSSNHLLNFITVYDDSEKKMKYIFDGQQRTVSVILIICSLIKKLREIGSVSLADDITKDFILFQRWSDDAETYKINFEKDTTNKLFQNYIAKGISIPKDLNLTDNEKAMKVNYEYFQYLFVAKLGATPTEVTIKTVIKNIVDNVVLIVLETTDEEIATKMFDTLNSTGLQLADFYVLKNTLVRILGEDTVRSVWDSIESNTNGLSKKKFLFTYVNAFNGKTGDKNLYSKIESEKNLSNPTLAIEVLEELKITSKSFLTLDSPTQRTKGDAKDIQVFIDKINTLKIVKSVQYKPVIIAMEIRKFSLSGINRVLNDILKLQLRNMFIAQEPGNTLEQFYPELAQKIYRKDIISVDGILSEINNMMLSDQIIKDKFKVKLINTRNEEVIFRHIIREIYNYENKEIKINPDTTQITLEHVLPQNPTLTSNWVKDFDDEIRYKYTYSIGNLTILLGDLNNQANNYDFSRKTTDYNQSTIPQNKKIALNTTWTATEIDNRTIELSNIFNKVWNKV